MTAILHATYSFLYISQLNIKMFEGETTPAGRVVIVQLLTDNLPRIEAGLAGLSGAP